MNNDKIASELLKAAEMLAGNLNSYNIIKSFGKPKVSYDQSYEIDSVDVVIPLKLLTKNEVPEDLVVEWAYDNWDDIKKKLGNDKRLKRLRIRGLYRHRFDFRQRGSAGDLHIDFVFDVNSGSMDKPVSSGFYF